MQRTVVFVLALALASTFALAVTTPAEAACSYNGYINSEGKCMNSFPRNWNWSYQHNNRYYEYRDQTLIALIEHLQQMIRQLESQLDDDYDYGWDDSDVTVSTRSAINVEEDEATLRGRVYLGSEDEAEVYFEYSESRSDLDEETSSKTIEDHDSSYYFQSRITGLDEDTRYYYRAVVEDEDGDGEYGAIYSFRTDDESSNRDEEPDLNTHEADDVDEESAELSGTVDMNDFNNGIVFFVYGEDEDQVEDIEDKYEAYSDIDEDGDDLQKVLVDNDLDNNATYQRTVDNLDPDTDIYYSICVEYEDEDDDETIACGDVEEFETDD